MSRPRRERGARDCRVWRSAPAAGPPPPKNVLKKSEKGSSVPNISRISSCDIVR
jgi:hypothetical protein